MEIMEIAALLGKTLKEDERLKALEEAKEAYTSDAELQKKLVEYEVQQRALQGEITKEERDTAFIDIIQNRIEQLYKEITEAPAFIRLNEVQAEVNELMNAINNTITFGEGGRMILSGPMGIPGISKISSFTAGFVLVLITLFVIFNLVNSRSGRAIMAIRDARVAAESVGINVAKYKMMAFVTSAALAGAAGALFSLGQNTIIASKFDFNTSILILVFVVLGGMGNIMGSVISATVLYILPEAMRGLDDLRMILYAVVLIVVMLCTWSPKLKQNLQALRERIKEKFSKVLHKKEVASNE